MFAFKLANTTIHESVLSRISSLDILEKFIRVLIICERFNVSMAVCIFYNIQPFEVHVLCIRIRFLSISIIISIIIF